MNAGANTGITRELWLWLLAEGGFSTAKEIAHGMGFPKSEEVGRIIATMHKGGFVARRDKAAPGQFSRYGITAACKVPSNIRLADLAGCGVVQLDERTTEAAQ